MAQIEGGIFIETPATPDTYVRLNLTLGNAELHEDYDEIWEVELDESGVWHSWQGFQRLHPTLAHEVVVALFEGGASDLWHQDD